MYIGNFIPKAKEFFQYKWTLLRTAVLGTLIGIIPATGANVACLLSYDITKRFSKHPETFGKGDVEGVIASECANNAVCGGAMVPLLTLGIPGDGVTAILLGGLMIHDIQPGSTMYTEQYHIIIGIFTCMLVCTLMMVLIQMIGIKFFIRLLSVPNDLLVPGIAVMMVIGSFAMRNNLFDVGICLVLRSLSYFMGRADYPVAPAVLGLVLGGTFEKELRTAMVLSDYKLSSFFTNPVSCVFITVGIVFALWLAVHNMRAAK